MSADTAVEVLEAVDKYALANPLLLDAAHAWRPANLEEAMERLAWADARSQYNSAYESVGHIALRYVARHLSPTASPTAWAAFRADDAAGASLRKRLSKHLSPACTADTMRLLGSTCSGNDFVSLVGLALERADQVLDSLLEGGRLRANVLMVLSAAVREAYAVDWHALEPGQRDELVTATAGRMLVQIAEKRAEMPLENFICLLQRGQIEASALQVALPGVAGTGRVALVEQILQRLTELQDTMPRGLSEAVVSAASVGSEAVVECLLQRLECHGALQAFVCKRGYLLAMEKAAVAGARPVMQRLARLGLTDWPTHWQSSDSDWWNADIAGANAAVMPQAMLDAAILPMPPLQAAAAHDRLEMAQDLLSMVGDARQDLVLLDGAAAVKTAAKNGHAEMLALLLAALTRPAVTALLTEANEFCQLPILEAALLAGQGEVVAQLLTAAPKAAMSQALRTHGERLVPVAAKGGSLPAYRSVCAALKAVGVNPSEKIQKEAFDRACDSGAIAICAAMLESQPVDIQRAWILDESGRAMHQIGNHGHAAALAAWLDMAGRLPQNQHLKVFQVARTAPVGLMARLYGEVQSWGDPDAFAEADLETLDGAVFGNRGPWIARDLRGLLGDKRLCAATLGFAAANLKVALVQGNPTTIRALLDAVKATSGHEALRRVLDTEVSPVPLNWLIGHYTNKAIQVIQPTRLRDLPALLQHVGAKRLLDDLAA